MNNEEDSCWNDERYMRRCLQLAAMGRGLVSPNPMVGAVIVCGGRIIGEGYHRCCGGPHAEVNAICSVADPTLLPQSTIYVSLEPCAHYGKTPPCSELIIASRIPRVVVGCVDPFASVAGRGIALLRQAGIEVMVGVLERECLRLNQAFITAQTQHRPYVILKWAQSADGYIDSTHRADESPALISTPVTRAWVHQLRTQTDAIWIGTRTAIQDDPSLTPRCWGGRTPLRIVSDRTLRLPRSLQLFSDGLKTCVLTECRGRQDEGPVSYLQVPFGPGSLLPTLEKLADRKIESVLVEGGRELLESFIREGCWDEVRIEIAPSSLLTGVAAPVLREGVLVGSSVYNRTTFLFYERCKNYS